MEVGLDDDEDSNTLKERKLKRFEEIRKKKMEEMENRRRRDKSAEGGASKSPTVSRSPFRGG